ncbi:MAG TPA: quinol:cytochrome C oxidoreductase [Candidatus Marinimicrobia bacterium]|nr:MAG: hypothetical protein AUJ47_02230 [Candidatus Marinimicrobia bacterium CG1_02_48_14]HCW76415.1 quinol:cytochrome C oxidoreductase [Candidatus Neomarinimicrobiota bacterium]
MKSALLQQQTKFLIAALSLAILAGCYRGQPSSKPPIHLNPNMDTQEKYKPMGESKFYEDHLDMRTPPEGTVARGELRADKILYEGKNPDGSLVLTNPLPVSTALLKTGQERFNIYCSPCHGGAGDGKGIMTKYRYPVPPTNLHDQRLIDSPDGHFFDVITHGIRNMPLYAHQIPVETRWAIVAYVRALQLSQNASLADVPKDVQAQLGKK